MFTKRMRIDDILAYKIFITRFTLSVFGDLGLGLNQFGILKSVIGQIGFWHQKILKSDPTSEIHDDAYYWTCPHSMMRLQKLACVDGLPQLVIQSLSTFVRITCMVR